MAEEDAEDPISEPKPSPQPARYLVLILLVLLAEAGAGCVLLDRVIPEPEELPREEDEVQEKVKVKNPIYYTNMIDIIVNPISPTGSHLVRFSFALQVSSESTLEEIGIRHDVLWDLVLQNTGVYED
jgi:flagellar basal body-associated protein FliL